MSVYSCCCTQEIITPMLHLYITPTNSPFPSLLFLSHLHMLLSWKRLQLIYEMCTLLPPSKKFLRNQPYFNYSDSILLFLCIVSYKENYFKEWCSSGKGSATLRCIRSGISRGNGGAITETDTTSEISCSVGHLWTGMFCKIGTDVEKGHKAIQNLFYEKKQKAFTCSSTAK